MNALKRLADEELITLCRAGENKSMNELVARYGVRLLAYIKKCTCDALDAEDIYQEVLIKVYLMIAEGRYSEKGKFVNLLMRIAHNMVADKYRRLRQSIVCSASEYDRLEETQAAPLVCDNAEDAMVKDQQVRQLQLMVGRLPSEQRKVVELRHYCGLSFREIAEETDVCLGTALGRMHYAVQNLRRMMRESEYALEMGA